MKHHTIIILLLLFTAGVLIINFDYLISVSKSKIIQASVKDAPGVAPEGTYPILVLHGFNPTYTRRFSEQSLKQLQDDLANDLGYSNRGLLTKETTCAELRYTEKPIILRATYFDGADLQEIQEYSETVGDLITRVINCTGAKKVDVITHSMGGIITRHYIKTHDDPSIRKLIMLGTPNHGGLYKVGDLVDIFIEEGESKISMDFVQLSESHSFVQGLNEDDETPGDVEYHTIAGDVDGQGDGLVRTLSVPLVGAKSNSVVPCRHFFMKYPLTCPEAYQIVKKILS